MADIVSIADLGDGTGDRYQDAVNLAESLAKAGSIRALEDLPRIRAMIDNGEVYWSGNCDEDCGWDGLSHRCNCGNRRVYWEFDTKLGMFFACEY